MKTKTKRRKITVKKPTPRIKPTAKKKARKQCHVDKQFSKPYSPQRLAFLKERENRRVYITGRGFSYLGLTSQITAEYIREQQHQEVK